MLRADLNVAKTNSKLQTCNETDKEISLRELNSLYTGLTFLKCLGLEV